MHVAHVVHHPRHGQARQHGQQPRQVAHVHQELQVPAQRCDEVGDGLHLVVAHAALEKCVDAHPAHAQGVHVLQCRAGHGAVDHGHAAQALRVALQGGQHAPVVGAVGADLHQHPALHAQPVEHAQIGGLRRRRGRVAAVGGQWIAGEILAHDVGVRIAGPGRHVEPDGRERVRGGRQVGSGSIGRMRVSSSAACPRPCSAGLALPGGGSRP